MIVCLILNSMQLRQLAPLLKLDIINSYYVAYRMDAHLVASSDENA